MSLVLVNEIPNYLLQHDGSEHSVLISKAYCVSVTQENIFIINL